jgi:glycosyltransferase involved in cell wall biosynthesis
VLFTTPAYWPAEAFGGPIPVMRSLAAGLVEDGHVVDVLTTSLVAVDRPAARRTHVTTLDGARVVYLATPMRYRWMGVTPTLPAWLGRLPRPDVVHIFGFRDPLGTATSAWCRLNAVPYVFEGLGMYRPKLRKVKLKRVLDATLYRHVPAGAAVLIAASRREREEYLASGIPPAKIVVRPNGFPAPATAHAADIRRRLRLPETEPLVLSVGRLAAGKGLELLVDAMPRLDTAHLVVVGPDDCQGVPAALRARAEALGVGGRVHLVGELRREEIDALHREAFAFALVSRADTFGMAAAEAASAGTALVVTDRCGIAELFDGSALVVPYDGGRIGDALLRLLTEPELRTSLGRAGQEVARRHAWPHVVEQQEQVYRTAIARARPPLIARGSPEGPAALGGERKRGNVNV